MFRGGHKNKKIHLLRLAVMTAFLSLCLSGCAMTHSMKNREGSAETDADSLVVYSPHPLDFINPIVSEFEAQTGISVQVRTGGDRRTFKMGQRRGRAGMRCILGRFFVCSRGRKRPV